MFQKNLEVLKEKNPALASKLEKINLESIKNVKAVEAETKDFIITYNDTALHSSLDPVREAKTTWYKTVKTDLRRNDIQIIFGLGLGYLFKRAFVNAESKIFILEPFIEVLRFVLEYVDFSKEFSENRIFITDNFEELMQKLHNEFLSGDRVEFLFLNSYAVLAQEMLINLTKDTLKICEAKSMDQNTIFNQCKFWTKNNILNMSNFPESRPVGFFEGAFSEKTALIVSAGPSLADDIQKIKKYRDKFVIIAVAPVLRQLIQSGITPDFAIFADANYLYVHIKEIEDKLENVNLVINSRAENCIIQEDFRSKLIYFSETDAQAIWFKENTCDNVGLYKSGGTVSILAYYFARALGCDPIVFTGLDLAFLDEKMYANGEKVHLDDSGNLYIHGKYVKKTVQVKGNNGQMILTRDDYALFIRHFEDAFAQDEGSARIVNTSISGAYIKGMEYLEFEKLASSLKSQNINLNKTLEDIFEKTSDKWSKSNDNILKELKKLKKNVENYDKLAKNIHSELKEICELFENPEGKINTIQTKVEAIKESMADIRNNAIQDPFLSTYLQSEIWQYAHQYNTNALPGMDDIKYNLLLELDLFNAICWSTDNISGWLKEATQKYKTKTPALK